MKQWYEKLFENYGKKYDNESYTKGTLGECDFFEKEIGYNKQIKILDIGCGTGRHSIELSKRGYLVTGIDLSDSQLKRAKEKANGLGLEIDFQKQDARKLNFVKQFDLVIMICEGAFPLMETDEMNYDILKYAKTALKGKGKLILTTLNAFFPLYHSVEKFHEETHEEGNAIYKSPNFDLMTFRSYDTTIIEDDNNDKFALECSERYYTPSEMTWLLKSLGFQKIEIFGARLGAFSREDKLQTKDFEMLVIAEL